MPFIVAQQSNLSAKETKGWKAEKRSAVMAEAVDSSWDLAFFQHKPNEEYDEYYCGCYGWD